MRFRAKSVLETMSGASEPSETSLLLLVRPALSAPPVAPELLGRGHVFWEDERLRTSVQTPLFHVSFPKPQLSVKELNDGMPCVEYRVEAQFGAQRDESDWRQLERTLISDADSDVVTALVPVTDEARQSSELRDLAG